MEPTVDKAITKSLRGLMTELDGPSRVWDDDLPAKYRRWRLCDFPDRWVREVMPFLAGDASTLYLFGGIGSRKSSFAAAVLKAWRWLRPLDFEASAFLPIYSFVNALVWHRSETMWKQRERWARMPCLVLDDLGSESTDEKIQKEILHFLQRRYDGPGQTLVTSNLNPAQLRRQIDPRVASRFAEGLLLKTGDKDWRQVDV